MARLFLFAAATLLLFVGGALCQPKTRNYNTRAEANKAAKELKDLNTQQRKSLWRSWKQENGREYADGSTQDKERFATWSANLDALIQHNQGEHISYFRGLNAFADQTVEELKASILMPDRDPTDVPARVLNAPKYMPRRSRQMLQTAPLTFDWRSLGKVPPPRNQGGCGSCWAFAGISALEIKAAIDGVNTTTTDYSEQQMVDCVNSQNGFWSGGCSGGWSDEVFSYVNLKHAATESVYPYTGTQGTCRQNSVSLAGAVTVKPSPGYKVVMNNAQALMQAVSSTGPVVIYFNVVDTFWGYSGGVYLASQCNTNTYNHAMVVVGYNATAGVGSPESYWIIRNSWGLWGDQGYVKVQMTADNVGACRMYDMAAMMLPLTTMDLGSVPSPSPSPPPPPSPPPRPPPSPMPPPSPPKACRGKKC